MPPFASGGISFTNERKTDVCQDRLGTNIRKLNKNGPFSRTTTQPDQSECSSRWLENRGKEKKKAVLEVRKRRFCPTTFRISKTISLPRQARDKNHRENDSKKSTAVRLFIYFPIRCMQAAKSLTVAMEAEGTLGEIGADTTLAGAPPRGNTP